MDIIDLYVFIIYNLFIFLLLVTSRSSVRRSNSPSVRTSCCFISCSSLWQMWLSLLLWRLIISVLVHLDLIILGWGGLLSAFFWFNSFVLLWILWSLFLFHLNFFAGFWLCLTVLWSAWQMAKGANSQIVVRFINSNLTTEDFPCQASTSTWTQCQFYPKTTGMTSHIWVWFTSVNPMAQDVEEVLQWTIVSIKTFCPPCLPSAHASA